MRRELLIALLCTQILAGLSFAQLSLNETITITTYYPSPYGVYRYLRLYPSEEPTVGVDRGLIYYNETEDTLKLMNKDGTWINIPLSGASIPATNGTGCILVDYIEYETAADEARDTECPLGYFTIDTRQSVDAAAREGKMLCCRVSNPPAP